MSDDPCPGPDDPWAGPGDAWAGLTEAEALRRVRLTLGCLPGRTPRWKAWTVEIIAVPGSSERVTIWCARRLCDGAITHGDTPGHLLEHIAYADEDMGTPEIRSPPADTCL